MNKYLKITPEGTRDLLFEECVVGNDIKSRLMQLFGKRGYHEVVTPTLEYLDMFSLEQSLFLSEQLYKLTDKNGRLLCLRPDLTMPIVRLVATRLKHSLLPLRLCYTEKVFRVNSSQSGRNNEVTQSGIEFIGAAGKRADLEVIVTAVEALRQCGARDFKIEIGHAGFFNTLTEELNVDADTREDVRAFVETKNYAALDALLDTLPTCNAVTILRQLPRLFGGISVIETAMALCGDTTPKSLCYLKEIYEDLAKLDLEDKIKVDLGLVHRNSYYTGILFRGYIEGSGVTVLSGGRYDNLLTEFGLSLPAIGFAVENDALAAAMLQKGNIAVAKPADVLVFGEDGFEIDAVIYANKLIEKGFSAIISAFDTVEDTRKFALANGITRIDIVGKEVSTIEVNK